MTTGLEMGDVSLDAPLDGSARRRRALQADADARGHVALALFPFQERGHGWLRLLGDLGIGAILADDMGLGKTVQAIAMLVSEREEFGREALGLTLVVCPMSVARQWVHELERFAPGLRVHLHHGIDTPVRAALLAAARWPTSWSRRTTLSHATSRRSQLVAWDRLLLDEAQDVKNPRQTRACAAPVTGAAPGRDDGNADREPSR